MKTKIQVSLLLASAVLVAAQNVPTNTPREHIRIVHQDISKWDKNGDGKLTGEERDAFLAAKRKESADAEAAKRAGKVKPQSKPKLPDPTLRPEDTQKPRPTGIPKNLEGVGE
ncbi:MAG TPA: hypothetical protein VGR78_16050 [Verrucomicrobiae bacterium]|nr:hypothetical protein [Verrucomicrobiae bacterium]